MNKGKQLPKSQSANRQNIYEIFYLPFSGTMFRMNCRNNKTAKYKKSSTLLLGVLAVFLFCRKPKNAFALYRAFVFKTDRRSGHEDAHSKAVVQKNSKHCTGYTQYDSSTLSPLREKLRNCLLGSIPKPHYFVVRGSLTNKISALS